MELGFFSRLTVVAALCLSSGAFAAGQKIPSEAGTEPAAALAGRAAATPQEKTAGLFSKPVVFRGTLGDMPIQLVVRPKEMIDEGLEGEYFIFGQSHKILLAGEFAGENLLLEESENGTNISGQWQGKLQGDLIQGTWTSADDSVSKPFQLKPMPPAGTQKPVPARKASAANAASATSVINPAR